MNNRDIFQLTNYDPRNIPTMYYREYRRDFAEKLLEKISDGKYYVVRYSDKDVDELTHICQVEVTAAETDRVHIPIYEEMNWRDLSASAIQEIKFRVRRALHLK